LAGGQEFLFDEARQCFSVGRGVKFLQPLRAIFRQLYDSLPGIDYSEVKSVRQTGGRLFPACSIGNTINIAASRAGLLSFPSLPPSDSIGGSKESVNDFVNCKSIELSIVEQNVLEGYGNESFTLG